MELRLVEATKTCNKCNKSRLLAEYGKNCKSKDSRRSECNTCRRDYYQANKEKIKARTKKAYTPEYGRQQKLKKNYGISIEDYNKMFSDQDGKCKICLTHQSKFKKPLFVDHCHRTGDVRGLLCHNCNIGISNFKDNLELFKSAMSYLEGK